MPRSQAIRTVGLALLTVLTLASVVRGQQQVDATLRLRVLSTTDAPLAAAEVTLKGHGATVTARTDSAGDALFSRLRAGLQQATIRRVGFAAAAVDLRVGEGENVLIVRLDRATATLDAVRIVSSRLTTARLDDFETRRLRGDASAVISREEIEKRDPIALSQLLRRVPGLRVADSLGSTVAKSTRGQKMSRSGTSQGLVDCVMRITVDGVVMPPLSNIDAIVPKTVHGIEIFSGPARLPVQMGGLRTDNWCGVIAIWTRDH